MRRATRSAFKIVYPKTDTRRIHGTFEDRQYHPAPPSRCSAPWRALRIAPCRRLMAQHGAGFTVSEMVSSRALVYGDHKTVSLLKAEPNGAPYGVQIFGEVPEIMGEATAAIEQYAFDFVDINMGCPAPKVVRSGGGSSLMRRPETAQAVVEAAVRAVDIPVTVKIRAGWEEKEKNAVEIAKRCEAAGLRRLRFMAAPASRCMPRPLIWRSSGR